MIYFIQAMDGGLIKIGTTVTLTERLKTLARESGRQLRVLAVAKGSYEEENSLHKRFAHYRVNNEWFDPGEDLLQFIADECKAWDGSDEIRSYVVAKIDVEALGVAKKVAALKGMTLADYLSELVLPAATRDLHSEIKKISRNEQGE